MGAYAKGDRVRVSFEGTVNRVMPDFEGGQELRVEVDGLNHYIYTDTANVEKIEPLVETFGPGDVVREKGVPVGRAQVRTLGLDGWINHADGSFYNAPRTARTGFTSDGYERVEVS